MEPISNIIKNIPLPAFEPNHSLNENTETIHPKTRITFNKLDAKTLFRLFRDEYKILFGVDFIRNDETEKFVYTLICYFLNDEKFYRSPCLRKIDNAEYSLRKGLIIVGNFGVGKSSILKTFYSLFKSISLHSPSVYFWFNNSYDIVNEYERLETPSDKDDFMKKYTRGFRLFDDVKSERHASNFGKVNLFQDIFFQRHENKAKTIITCNYDLEYPNDFDQAINEFGLRYGPRVYDRLLQSYNFLELGGKSLRK